MKGDKREEDGGLSRDDYRQKVVQVDSPVYRFVSLVVPSSSSHETTKRTRKRGNKDGTDE